MFWFVVLSESSNIQKEVAIQQLISKLKFETARLSVENWGRILSDPSKRNKLESELKVILTPTIMYRLPLSMKFSADEDSISKWVDDRVNDVQILCVHERDTSELMGLILLFDNPEETVIPTIQLGYILGEPNWGKGYATEMVKALLTALGGGPRMRLAAGVDRENVASAAVLEKSGFRKIPEQTTAGRFGFELEIN